MSAKTHDSTIKDVAIVLAAAWAARLLFLLVVPPAAHSADIDHWMVVVQALASGANPYQVTPWLNWPPVWMLLVSVMATVGDALHVPFGRVLQAFLIGIESLLIVALLRLLSDLVPQANARRLVLWGIALNPIAILLVCQHGNFDVLVALLVVLFLHALIRFGRGNDPVDWLIACCFLGLGIVTKSVPAILAPLLFVHVRDLPQKTRLLGAFLTVGPVALGLGVIYVLSPQRVAANVLGYRSYSGWFGVTGLMQMAGAESLIPAFATLFGVALGVAVIGLAVLVWRRPALEDRELVLFAALLLVGLPALGPGYAPQYIFWFLPLLVVTFAAFEGPWRRVVAVFAAVAVATYLVEYALFPSHGMFLSRMTNSEPFMTWSTTWSTQKGQTLIRLPLFAAYLLLLVGGVAEIRRGASAR